MKIERTKSLESFPAVQPSPTGASARGAPQVGWKKQSDFDAAMPMKPLWQPPQQNPFIDTDEFGHALHSVFDRFGSAGAQIIGNVINQLHNGIHPPVSTQTPQPGDVMVWGPNAGDDKTAVGKADDAGHVGVVEKVTDNGDGTVTVRVSERNWNNRDGVDENGVPYRDIRLKKNPDGTLSLPDGRPLPPGVGFVSPTGSSGQANPSGAPAKGPGAPASGTKNPPIGPNPPPNASDHPEYRINNTPAHNKDDGYKQCVGYIHDMPQYKALIEKWANGGYLRAADIPTNSKVPKPGDLMVWGVGAGNATVGQSSGKDGHVAYVEAVQPNYDPPGDPHGKIVSYTVTVSEANGDGKGDNDRTLRTFTVPADANGNAQLPDHVGFYDPNGPASSSPSGGTASSGAKIARNSTYTVQEGDTLSDIAARAGVSVDALLRANPGIKDPSMIAVGQRIRIP